MFNPELKCYWKGSIKADGSVFESSIMTRLSEDESQKLVEELAKKISAPPPKPGGYGH